MMTPGQAAYERQRELGLLSGRNDPLWEHLESQWCYWESIAQAAIDQWAVSHGYIVTKVGLIVEAAAPPPERPSGYIGPTYTPEELANAGVGQSAQNIQVFEADRKAIEQAGGGGCAGSADGDSATICLGGGGGIASAYDPSAPLPQRDAMIAADLKSQWVDVTMSDEAKAKYRSKRGLSADPQPTAIVEEGP